MRIIAKTFLLLLGFLLISHGTSAVASPKQTAQTADSDYAITVIPFYGPEIIWALYAPFVDFLKQSTGRPWNLKLYPTHEALITGFCEGQVALALVGPIPLARMMDRCNAEPIVVALGKDGTPSYRSVLVSTDPEIDTVSDLKGKRIGFFKGSTAAHILPREMLSRTGLTNRDYLPVFFEGQDHIVNALLARKITAAGIKESLYGKFKNEGFRVLATSKPVPNFAFAASPKADAGTKNLFADTLLRLKPSSVAEERERMKAWDDEIKNGFVPSTAPFRASVKDLLTLTNRIMNEDRQ